MKKIAVFVEGQSELIFIRNILFHLFDPSLLSFTCLELCGNGERSCRYDYTSPNPSIHFQIVNVGGDEKVLNVLKEREQNLINNGFEKIIGLRDMYSERYLKHSASVISNSLNQRFINGANQTISGFVNSNKIYFHFSIMEVEAWWLSMYRLFEKVNELLTVNYILENTGLDLSQIDPQNCIFHPTRELNTIFNLIGDEYEKKYGQIERITSNINNDDIQDAIYNGRCNAFENFLNDLQS